MKKEQPSNTYKEVYYKIVDPIFNIICNNEPIKYCVKAAVDNKSVQYAIQDSFQFYVNKTKKSMVKEGKPDRHKLAACLCGAIVKVQPLCPYSLKPDQINETAAMYAGLLVIEYYMRYTFIKELSVPEEEQQKVLAHFKNDFYMHFPENICDIKDYGKNLINALYRSHSKCEVYRNGKECFQYDIWAYAKIFYHLELYNQQYIKESYDKYLANRE